MSASARSTRKVYHTELGGSVFEIDSLSEVTEDLYYDTDASATTLLANTTNRDNFNSKSCLPSEHCAFITTEEKDSWDKLTPNTKSAMLKGKISNRKPKNRSNDNGFNNPSHGTITLTSCKPKPFTKSNLHRSLHKLIVESNESEYNAVDAEDAEENNDSTLFFNSKTANKVNPGDMRNSLSVPSKGNSTPSPTKKIVN